jgi:hypothetical protein
MENLKLIIDTYDGLQKNGMYKVLSMLIFDYTGDLTETETELLNAQLYLKIKFSKLARGGRRRITREHNFCRLCNHSGYQCLQKVTNHGSSRIHKENVDKYNNMKMDLLSNDILLKSFWENDFYRNYTSFSDLMKCVLYLRTDEIQIVDY